jgi:hypothetical protein
MLTALQIDDRMMPNVVGLDAGFYLVLVTAGGLVYRVFMRLIEFPWDAGTGHAITNRGGGKLTSRKRPRRGGGKLASRKLRWRGGLVSCTMQDEVLYKVVGEGICVL